MDWINKANILRREKEMDWETYGTCLGTLLDSFEMQAKYDYYNHLRSPIEMMKLELRLLIMFVRGLGYWEELEYDWHLRFAIKSMMSKLSRIAGEFVADCRHVDGPDQWLDLEAMMYDFKKTVDEQVRTQVMDTCLLVLGCAFEGKCCPVSQKKFIEYGRDTASFIELALHNLEGLLNADFDLIAPVMKQQVVLAQREMEEFGVFVEPVNSLCDLISRTRTWSNRISCLICLYWVNGKVESLAPSMEKMFSGLLHKTMLPNTSRVMSSCFQHTVIPQFLASYLDFLLEDLVMLKKDEIEILHEGLIFLLSFIMDPPEDDDSVDGEMIWVQNFGVMNNFPSLIYSIRYGEMKGGACKASFSDFLLKVDIVKEKVKNLYLMVPYSSKFRSPSINATGFLDLLMGNLKKMLEGEVNLVPCLKHPCQALQKELPSFRPVVNNIMELLQSESGEIKDLCTQIINMVCNADYFIKLCPARSFSIWYGIIGLSKVNEDINRINISIKNIGIDQMENKKNPTTYHEVKGMEAWPPSRVASSAFNGAFIGFEEDERRIINGLTRGTKSLTIISIWGSAGQGKTTLAKKIYSDPNIRDHFHNTVWCYISKIFRIGDLLVQMIHDVTGYHVVKMLEIQDLIEHLRKCLKGRRYLIVMDDIWDVEAWHNLEWSFPDDNNGSRILFTSRNHELASKAKPGSISHPLPLFLLNESWELLKKKVFGCDDCPEEFVGIGKKIALYCKGLPLAVALIASILERIERKLDLWDEVAKNLKLHLSQEGCGEVIELSYRYLSNNLKPCFLYFGMFPRGLNIWVKKLKLLWMAEGFLIQNGRTKSSEDLATEYLNKLVSQSLVVVTKKSSTGRIKRCNVHDLLYDLCRQKAYEDKFIDWADESVVGDDNNCSKYNHHRLHIGITDPFIESKPVVTSKNMPTSPVHSLLFSSHQNYWKAFFSFLESFKNLTVLDLDLDLDSKKLERLDHIAFPEVILCIIHLRFLALKFKCYFGDIPPAIDNLWNLEAILISTVSWDSFSLPASIWNIRSLKHVHIDNGRPDLEDFEKQFVACSNLETLGSLRLAADSRTANFLSRFPKVKKMTWKIERPEHVFEYFYVVGSLKNLESFKIFNHGVPCPYPYEENPAIWHRPMIENLTKLSLGNSELPWSILSEIGKNLPNLQVLKLIGNACLGHSWKLEDGEFSRLRCLKLKHFLNIKEIDVSSCEDNPPFPSLEHFVVKSCHDFQEIPISFGEIYSLKRIKVSYCNRRVEASAMAILEQQREMENDIFQAILVGNE